MRLQCFNSSAGRVGTDFNERRKKRQAVLAARLDQMRLNVRTVTTISNQNFVVLREALRRVLKDEQKDRAELIEDLTAFAEDDVAMVKHDLGDLFKQLEVHLNETFTCTTHAKAYSTSSEEDCQDCDCDGEEKTSRNSGAHVDIDAEAYIDV